MISLAFNHHPFARACLAGRFRISGPTAIKARNYSFIRNSAQTKNRRLGASVYKFSLSLPSERIFTAATQTDGLSPEAHALNFPEEIAGRYGELAPFSVRSDELHFTKRGNMSVKRVKKDLLSQSPFIRLLKTATASAARIISAVRRNPVFKLSVSQGGGCHFNYSKKRKLTAQGYTERNTALALASFSGTGRGNYFPVPLLKSYHSAAPLLSAVCVLRVVGRACVGRCGSVLCGVPVAVGAWLPAVFGRFCSIFRGCVMSSCSSLLPSALSSALSVTPAVAVSGARNPAPASLVALGLCLSAVPSSVPVSVGCARGVDACVRSARPSARVFRASSFGSGRLSFVRRSAAVVGSVPWGSVFLAFPGVPCPSVVVPRASVSSCFCGGGSGTWASLALAVGVRLRCFFFLPASVPPPAWLGVRSLGGGWWVAW